MNLDEKMEFWAKKFIFHQISKIHQKSSIFSKKIQTLFCFKITCICRKLIPKLASEISESKLWDYEAWNAPKFNLTLLARLKAQKYTFSAQISRILDFQNLKLARLKPVNKNKALNFTMRSSIFRALNAPKRANMKISKIKNLRDFALKCFFELLIAPNVSKLDFGAFKAS
mgnify:CR=1 FL=1